MKLWIDPRLRSAVVPPIVLASDLDTNERMCVGVIAMYGEVAFPRRELIALGMGCSLATVKRTLAQLKAKGWLMIEHRRGENGRQTTNRYHLRVPDAMATISTAAAAQPEPRSEGQPDPAPGSGCTASNTLKKISEEKEELPPATPPAPPPPTPEETKKARLAYVDALLDVFVLESHRLTDHSPEREIGRDRKLMGDALKVCGESYEDTSATLTDWLEWRVREHKVITMPAWRGAVEAAYQKWRERKGKTGPGGAPREHRSATQHREWQESVKKHKEQGGSGLPSRGAT